MRVRIALIHYRIIPSSTFRRIPEFLHICMSAEPEERDIAMPHNRFSLFHNSRIGVKRHHMVAQLMTARAALTSRLSFVIIMI